MPALQVVPVARPKLGLRRLSGLVLQLLRYEKK
jgi:hypothetical protein